MGEEMTRRHAFGLSLLMSLLIVFMGMVIPYPAYAEPTGRVELSIEADKDAYESGETAIFTLAVHNTSNSDITDVSYAVTLPGEMELVEGSNATGSVASLASGETYTTTLQARVLAPANASAAISIPQTGDGALATIAACVGGAVLFGVAAYFAHRHNSATAVILVVALGFACILNAGMPHAAYAADAGRETASTSCDIAVAGQKKTVRASVSYTVSAGGPEEPVEPGDEVETMTRAEWISTLLDGVGATDLDTNAEPFDDISGHVLEADVKTAWVLGILPDDANTFEPDAVATRDFVYAVAALAADVDTEGKTLTTPDAADAEHPELLAAALDAGLLSTDAEGNVNPSAVFDVSEADGLVERIAELLGAGRETGGGSDPQASWKYRKDVTVITDFVEQDGRFVVSSAEDIHVGNRVAFEPSELEDAGGSGVVTSVRDEDNARIVEIDQADDPRDIFTSIYLSAYDVHIDASSVELADGVVFDDAPLGRMARDRYEGPTLKLKLEYPPDEDSEGGLKITGSIEVTPAIDAALDWRNILSLPTSFELGVSQSTTVKGGIEAELKEDVTIPLTKKPIEVRLFPGLMVGLNLDLKVTAEGEIGLEVTVDSTVGVEYSKKGGLKPYADFDAGADFGFEGELKAGVSPWASLNLLKMRIVDAAFDGGLAGKGSMKLRETGMICNDITLYAYAKIVAGEHSPLFEWLEFTAEYEFWDEDDSPFRENAHWENGVKVPECTYKADGDDEDPSQTDGDFVWEDLEDGRWIVDYVGDATDVTIPVKIDGEPVVGIGFEEAGMQKVKSIHFAEGSAVQYVSYGAISDGVVLEVLDLENASHLKGIGLMGTNVKSLDLSGLSELESFYSNGLSLTRLVLSGNKSLGSLTYVGSASEFEEPIAFNEAPNLQALDFDAEGLASIDLSDLKGLQQLAITGTSFSELDLSGNLELVNLTIGDAALDALDVSNHEKLEQLDCSNCGLTQLNVSNTPSLTYLNCSGNKIVDLSSVLSHPNYEPDFWGIEQK